MSCVPSINAYVATHTCHQEETEKEVAPPAKPLPTTPPEPEKVQKSWLGTFMDKFMFLGHDGVGLTSSDTCTKLGKSSDETDTNKNSIDILSRVRHFSNDSMTSTDESTAPSSSSGILSDRARHLSNPER